MAYCVSCRERRDRRRRDRALNVVAALLIIGIAWVGMCAFGADAASTDAGPGAAPPAGPVAARQSLGCRAYADHWAVAAIREGRRRTSDRKHYDRVFAAGILLHGRRVCGRVFTGLEYTAPDGETWYAGEATGSGLVTGP